MPGYLGGTLSGFADTYLKTRDQMARESEMSSVADYRKLQADHLRQQMDAENAPSDPNTIETLAGQPPAEDYTLAEGKPEQPGTMTDNAAGQPPVPQQQGGTAPDADLGNQPMNVTATPGTPGQPAITQKIRTYADAVKLLGAQKVGQLMKTKAGVDLLRSKGYISDAELESRRMAATADQEWRSFSPRIREAAEAGNVAGQFNLQGAAYERLAEVSSDPSVKENYRALSVQFYDKAAAIAQDKNLEQDAAAKQKAFSKAIHEYQKDPTDPGKYAALEDAAADLRSNKATAHIAENFYAGFSQVASKLMADPAQQAQLALQTYVSDARRLNPVLTHGQALKEALKQHPELYAQTVDAAMKSQDPDTLAAYGLSPIKFMQHPGEMAAIMAASDGLHFGDPKWGQAVTAYYKQLYQAQSKATVAGQIGPRLTSYRGQLDGEIKSAQTELQKLRLEKGEQSEEATQKEREIQDLRSKRLAVDERLAEIGIAPGMDEAGEPTVPGRGTPPRAPGQPKGAAAPPAQVNNPGGGKLRQGAVDEGVRALSSSKLTRALGKKQIKAWFDGHQINLEEYKALLNSPAYTNLPVK